MHIQIAIDTSHATHTYDGAEITDIEAQGQTYLLQSKIFYSK